MSETNVMKFRESKLREWKPIHRFAFLLFGLMLIGTGAFSLLNGRTHYHNFWGAPVFAPFVIFVGLLFLVGLLTHSRNK